jgi:hypothetical protein
MPASALFSSYQCRARAHNAEFGVQYGTSRQACTRVGSPAGPGRAQRTATSRGAGLPQQRAGRTCVKCTISFRRYSGARVAENYTLCSFVSSHKRYVCQTAETSSHTSAQAHREMTCYCMGACTKRQCPRHAEHRRRSKVLECAVMFAPARHSNPTGSRACACCCD